MVAVFGLVAIGIYGLLIVRNLIKIVVGPSTPASFPA